MPFSTIPLAGFKFDDVVTAAEAAAGTKKPHCTVGNSVVGNDGKTYVYAKANAAIPANTAVCAIGASPTFLVAATGGSYTSPAIALASGDFAWFSKALV